MVTSAKVSVCPGNIPIPFEKEARSVFEKIRYLPQSCPSWYKNIDMVEPANSITRLIAIARAVLLIKAEMVNASVMEVINDTAVSPYCLSE